MKKFLPLFLLTLFVFFAYSASKARAAGTVVHIGDSLTAGMYMQGLADKYSAAGLTAIIPGNNPTGSGACDGYKAGFPCKGVSPTGLEAVDANKDIIKSASDVVIELGTNMVENDFKGAMSQMIDKIRAINPNAKIFWVNLVAKVNIDKYSERNKIIMQVATEKNISVIDWFHKVYPTGDPTNIDSSLVDTNNWIGAEGIHLSDVGYQAMAGTIVTAVTNGGTSGSTNGTSSTTPGSTGTSDCVTTKVGTPATSPAPPAWCKKTSGSGSTSNNDLVKAAEDIMAAYGKCGDPAFITIVHDGLNTCLTNFIKGLGTYAPDKIAAFTQRISSSQIGHNGKGYSCTECLGYVGQALSLSTGEADSLVTGYGAASGVSHDFTLKGSTFKRMPDGTKPQPGDIGVSYLCGGNPCAGHIIIVKALKGQAQYYAIESNQKEDCGITSERPVDNDAGYSFFRKQ